ncbi:MAG: hypothetical protein Q8L29_00155 [archaeon]|nr:hypothetical protein [archaeon]
MQNRGKKRVNSGIALCEILLLIGMSFAIAFILSEEVGLGSAAGAAAGANAGAAAGANAGKVPSASPVGIMAFVKKIYGGAAFGTQATGASTTAITGSALTAGAAWALTAYAAIKLLGKLFGLEAGLTNSLALSVAGGLFAYQTLNVLATNGIFGSASATMVTAAPFIGLGVAAAIFIYTYKTEKLKLVTFQCLPWEAPIGGTNCEECNKDVFRPCSEYRCRSLGQACQLLNVGTSGEKCTWVNPKDVKSPTIKPTAPLTDGLKYVPDTTRPPALGAKIIRSAAGDGCLQAFTPLEFSVETNEPAQCKVDYNHTINFEGMQYFFGESNYFEYNHTQHMKLPGLDTGTTGALSPIIKNDGTYSIYVRCRDANGNENVDEFSFGFCVGKGPDTTPPRIEGTSIIDGSPVQYNIDHVPIEVYVNEPAECKWSRIDKAYKDMENPMTCATQSYQINANLAYTCSGTLTGIKNLEENKFYFRCKDQPGKPDNERYENTQSYPLTLKGTQALNIIKVEPNMTLYGSTSVIIVNLELETSNGAEEGKAKCYFSSTGTIDSYIPMWETDNHIHKQSLDLISGSYKYYFRCIDAGGNADEASTSFSVFVDRSAPKITRIYKEGDNLKVVTDEKAECVYSLSGCNYNFNDGLKFSYINPDDKTVEVTPWKATNVYFIKCKDEFGNMPLPNACLIEASATQLALGQSI